jgi:hypothetical protein
MLGFFLVRELPGVVPRRAVLPGPEPIRMTRSTDMSEDPDATQEFDPFKDDEDLDHEQPRFEVHPARGSGSPAGEASPPPDPS